MRRRDLSRELFGRRFQIATVRHDEDVIKMVVDEDFEIPSERAAIRFQPASTRLYRDDWIVDEGKAR